MAKTTDLKQITVYLPLPVATELEAEVEARSRTGRRTTLAALVREVIDAGLEARRPVRKAASR